MSKRANSSEWRKLRLAVYRRDSGVCQVCGTHVDLSGEFYECGHVVDRCAGGVDTLENLVVMCVLCNRLKPVHDTRADYDSWLARGYWRADMQAFIADEINAFKKA